MLAATLAEGYPAAIQECLLVPHGLENALIF